MHSFTWVISSLLNWNKNEFNNFSNCQLQHLNNGKHVLEGYFAASVWRPVIERSDLPNAYLTGLTHENLLNGNFQRVPLLTGITSEESMCKYWHV